MFTLYKRKYLKRFQNPFSAFGPNMRNLPTVWCLIYLSVLRSFRVNIGISNARTVYACTCSASATVATSTVIFVDGFAKYILGSAKVVFYHTVHQADTFRDTLYTSGIWWKIILTVTKSFCVDRLHSSKWNENETSTSYLFRNNTKI